MLKPHHAIARTKTEGCALWWYDFLKIPLFSPTLNQTLKNSSISSLSASSSLSPSQNENQAWWSNLNKNEWSKQPKSLTVARIALTMMYPEEINSQMCCQQKSSSPAIATIRLKSSGFSEVTANSELFLPIPVNLFVATLELFVRRFTTASASPIEKNKIRVAFWKIAAFVSFRVVELDAHEIARCLSTLSQIPPPSSCGGWDKPIFQNNNNQNDKNDNKNKNNQILTTPRDVCSYLSCQARLKARRYNAMISLVAIQNDLPVSSNLLPFREFDIESLSERVKDDLLVKHYLRKSNKAKSSDSTSTAPSCQQNHSSTSILWNSFSGTPSTTNENENNNNNNIFDELNFSLPKSNLKKKNNNNLSTTEDKMGKILLTQLVRKKPVSISEFVNDDAKKANQKQIPSSSKSSFTPADRRRALIQRAQKLLMFRNVLESQNSSSSSSTSSSSSVVSNSLVWSTFGSWSDIFHQLTPQARASMLAAASDNISHGLPQLAPDQQHLTISRIAQEFSFQNNNYIKNQFVTNFINSTVAKAAFKSLLGYKELVGKLLHSSNALITCLNTNSNSNKNRLVCLSPNEIIPRLALTSSIPLEILGICAMQLALGSIVMKRQKQQQNEETTNENKQLALSVRERSHELVPLVNLHNSSGLMSPSTGIVQVMTFLGDLLRLVDQSEDDKKRISHPFVADVLIPYRTKVKKFDEANFGEDVDDDDRVFANSVSKVCSSIFLQVCYEMVMTNKATKQHNKNNNSKNTIRNHCSIPILISSAFGGTVQFENICHSVLSTRNQKGDKRKETMMLKLALLQSSMMESNFDFKFSNSDVAAAANGIAIQDKIALVEGRKRRETSVVGGSKDKNQLRLKLMIKMLRHGIRNSLLDNSETATLTPELKKAFQEIFEECDKLMLGSASNDNAEERRKMKELLNKMKEALKMENQVKKASRDCEKASEKDDEFEQKKYLAALGLM